MFNYFTQLDLTTTKRFQGAGLGLAISKRIVELMDGKIHVESEFGKGSTFSFTCLIDVSGNRPERTKEENKTEIVPSDREIRILLVEDDLVSQLVISEFSKQVGWKIDIASNGSEALRMLEKAQYCLILMDLQMPDMSGIEITRIILEKEKHTGRRTPIIAVTAYAMAGDKGKCKEAGMNDYLSKPVDLLRLKEMVESLCNPEINGCPES